MIPVRAAEPSCPSHKELVSIMHNLLHEEIDSFCKKVLISQYLGNPNPIPVTNVTRERPSLLLRFSHLI